MPCQVVVRRVAPEEQNVAIGARRSPIERIGDDDVAFTQLAAGEHASLLRIVCAILSGR